MEVVLSPTSVSAGPSARVEARLTRLGSSTSGFAWFPQAGEVRGTRPEVIWDLSGVGPGTYGIQGGITTTSPQVLSDVAKVTVKNCPSRGGDCPEMIMDCPGYVIPGDVVKVSVRIAGLEGHHSRGRLTPSLGAFIWTVSGGTIKSGQATDTITIDTKGTRDRPIRVTVTSHLMPRGCDNTASCTLRVK